MKILLATGNLGKLREMEEIFKKELPDVELLTLKDFDKVEEPIENGETFLANSLIKAMYYYDKFKVPVIADDTGLLVDALGGAPGVFTARYASINGEHADPVKNYTLLLKNLEGIKNRKAFFRTAMYFYDGKVLISALGEMHGEIAYEPVGTNGFGYDPIFYLPKYQKTVSQIGEDEKNNISHRGVASRNLVRQLKEYLK